MKPPRVKNGERDGDIERKRERERERERERKRDWVRSGWSSQIYNATR
jgi:hypothetical protein